MPSEDSLSSRLRRYSSYEGLFTNAKNLAELILSHQAPHGLQVLSTEQSYYVDHGTSHVERVISKLEALDRFLSSKINEKEAFVLLVAAYFHDIGMFLGRREGEDPEQTRAEHHQRSVDEIQKLIDGNFLNIPAPELSIMKKVIEAHRIIDLQNLPESQRVEGTEIRTRLLGALLRIADSCDCDRSRAPKAIFDLYYQFIPEMSRPYWLAHFPVTDVGFDERSASIVVSLELNEDLRGRIEKYRIGNLLRRKLGDELESVGEVFRYNNIPLVRVEIQDFNLGKRVELYSLPDYGDVIVLVMKSGFEKVEELASLITGFTSNTSIGFPLVIEIRPPEGILYIDTHAQIDGDRMVEISATLEERLGTDLCSINGKTVEKVTIRRGITR